MKRPTRPLVALVALLLAVPLGFTPTATAQQGGGCEQGSTPGLVVIARHHADGVQFTLVAHTSTADAPRGKLVFRAGSARVVRMEMHRVFLKDVHDGVGAGIRGKGYLVDGSVVRLHVDVSEGGPEGDRARVRWRDYHSEQEAHDPGQADRHDCEATWFYNSGWIPVDQVEIYQR
jgi:hypothetical protein